MNISSTIISSADTVDEFTQQVLGLPAIPSGDSGNVNINTPVLRVFDGGEVTVKNKETGEGGILNINANSILLNNQGKITASTQSGGGGNIDLQLKDSLILRNQSLIDAESFGTGDGGNINLNSPVIVGLENSDIIANAVEGNERSIQVKNNSPKKIVEATGWVVDKQGNIEFVAESNSVNALNSWQKTANCKGEIKT